MNLVQTGLKSIRSSLMPKYMASTISVRTHVTTHYTIVKRENDERWKGKALVE